MNNILITGGTGFLGAELIKDELLSDRKSNIHLLVREKGKIFNVLRDVFYPAVPMPEMLERITEHVGDITSKNLGLRKKQYRDLARKIDTIIHSAASTNLMMDYENLEKINVRGTGEVMEFAAECSRQGTHVKVNHISTAFVFGDSSGVFKEEELQKGQDFNNNYERSKYKAEMVINDYRASGIDIDVFRPSIILGRYTDGMTTNFKMLYQPMQLFSKELLEVIPAMHGSIMHIINVDTAARSIMEICRKNRKRNTNYHITSQKSLDLETTVNISADYFEFNAPEFIYDNPASLLVEYTGVQRMLIGPYLPYFCCRTVLDMSNTLDALKENKFVFPEMDIDNILRLCRYCHDSGFIIRGRQKDAVKR